MDGWIHPPDWIITTEVFQWKFAAVWWESLAGFIRLWHFECASLHLDVLDTRRPPARLPLMIFSLIFLLFGCKPPPMRICKCPHHAAPFKFDMPFYLFVFLGLWTACWMTKTRLEWVVTTKRGSNLCYQPVLGPASNNVGHFWFIECELNDILEIFLTFFWKILITKPQTVQLF